jgi:hypothetical protein
MMVIHECFQNKLSDALAHALKLKADFPAWSLRDNLENNRVSAPRQITICPIALSGQGLSYQY